MTGRWVRALIAGMLLAVLLGSSMPGAVLAQDASPLPSPAAAQRPDIVLLLLDDMPLMDDRVWDRLPTIRRLFLEQGVRFSDYSGNDPLCCPGRANLLTGQWSHHHGVVRNDARLFDPRESIATELHDAGYWTGIFGKYFNETVKLADPTPDGWDRSFIFGGNYYRYVALVDGQRVHFRDRRSDYSTTQVQRHAIAALRAARDSAQPRFLWLAPYAIHEGMDQAGVKHRDSVPLASDVGAPACAGIAPWHTPAFDETDMSDKPAFLQGLPALDPMPLRAPCETLQSVDRMLARVLAELAAEGRPDPLVILTVDNGMAWGAHHWWPKFLSYTTPIPLFIHWPAVLGTDPVTITTTVTNVDIAPTLCAIAGCAMGPYPNGFGVDGLSFLPVLLAKGGTLGREVIFEEHEDTTDNAVMVGWRGVRTTSEAAVGRWVYTEYATGERELYDISGGPCWTWQAGDPGDPCELTNLAGDPAHAALEARLAATVAAQETNPWRVLDAPP